MPITRLNPLLQLHQALVEYQSTTVKWFTLEIVLMAGINDRPEDYIACGVAGLREENVFIYPHKRRICIEAVACTTIIETFCPTPLVSSLTKGIIR